MLIVLIVVGVWIWRVIKNKPMTPERYAQIVTEDKGMLICFAPQPPEVATRMQHNGRLWVITKVVLQNTDSWLAKNRAYYAAHPGPRLEVNNAVLIETLSAKADGRLPEYFAIFGLPLDGP